MSPVAHSVLVPYAGIAVFVAFCLVLALIISASINALNPGRRHRLSRREDETWRACASADCGCANPPAAQFCRRCGSFMTPHSKPSAVPAVRR